MVGAPRTMTHIGAPSLHRDRSDHGLAFSPQLSSLRPSQIANHYLISHLPTIPFIAAVVGDLRLI
jgi:hypothetical protein